jgi:hypothetical protein
MSSSAGCVAPAERAANAVDERPRACRIAGRRGPTLTGIGRPVTRAAVSITSRTVKPSPPQPRL